MKIVADQHIPFIQDFFASYGELVLKPGRNITAQDVKDADLLIVRSITQVDKTLLAHSKVRFVGSVTAGADHLDTHWLSDAGIAWCIAEGFNAPPVANYVVSSIAALQREQRLKQKDLTAAVIGVGNVGKRVVNYLQKLNIAVTLCDPLRAENETDFVTTPLNELANFDIISLHVPLIKSGKYPTHHFINKDFLKQQKPGCVLLNASRGAVIDSNVLLKHGQHLQWCFDVWEHEPNISKLILEKSIIATPHIAGYSIQSKIRGIEMIYRLACEKQVIQPQTLTPIKMPTQILDFDNETHDWRDVVLSIFNPKLITTLMKEKLLQESPISAFDEMRNQFNYRYEFEFSRYSEAQLTNEDKTILNGLGIKPSV